MHNYCILASCLCSFHFLMKGALYILWTIPEYAFEWLDLPMLLAVLAAVIFVIYLMAMLGLTIWNTRSQNQNSTRKLNPKLGFLGLLGLLGFTGFWTYSAYEIITPLFFHLFWFFWIFFEGRCPELLWMSGFGRMLKKAPVKGL